MSDLKQITFTVSGTAMNRALSSDLVHRPQLYRRLPRALRAGRALQLARGSRQGKGFSYSITCDVGAADVIRAYFEGQAGQPHAGARACALAATRVSTAIADAS